MMRDFAMVRGRLRNIVNYVLVPRNQKFAQVCGALRCELRVEKRHYRGRLASVLIDSEGSYEHPANAYELRNWDISRRGGVIDVGAPFFGLPLGFDGWLFGIGAGRRR